MTPKPKLKLRTPNSKLPTLTDDPMTGDYQPRTEIGRLALAARKAYIAGGGELLNADEISAEVRRRRGGLADE
ncbi:hypothetical protein [Candidatus Thiodictyon syntrophicum]|jgi:hypothetical protein|uniref:Uncharacterized protein n=1 Tax=Candidatus Thiodictyon syntrophicum TaxID=1166950 RepID=A0A2K8UAP4_9GAMM|nr:hypothetical protein [Candidatus Thiodictyon syntrophicum]AUB82644.1 hypothetical protein THSYN_17970 [Candidatus Thiodictyon syntrophicum]